MERPPVWGINHLKLAASDIVKTKDFYCSVMGCTYIPEYDHRDRNGTLFALMVKLPHLAEEVLIEIRHNPVQAKSQEGWDPITFGVKTQQDLEIWKNWYEHNNVQCSRVFRGLKGWVSCAMDPDGKIVRLYCDEEHEWDSKNFDADDFWLR